jgi:membrane-associated phospholipid phosphatase
MSYWQPSLASVRVLFAMDTAVMLWIHRYASPPLDVAFVFSWLIGSIWFCGPLALLAAARHVRRGQRPEAVVWLVLAISVALLPEVLKLLVGRPRPRLWPWLIPTFGYSFPSGHSVAGAAFYPFLGWLVLRSRHLGLAAFVGVGRMYLGVHWPSDVVAGWALGVALSAGCIRWLKAQSSVGTT